MACLEVHRYFFNRGSKSRNKVAVGEPAAGSFFRMIHTNNNTRGVVSVCVCVCARALRMRARARARTHAPSHQKQSRLRAPVVRPPPFLGVGVCAVAAWAAASRAMERVREREREKSLPSSLPLLRLVNHGSHNVSRWMTWLPISLKNAAKCDNWYQLQNHSITESLNAKGAREKLSKSDPRACRISVSNNKSTRNARALLHGGDQRVQSNAGSEKK